MCPPEVATVPATAAAAASVLQGCLVAVMQEDAQSHLGVRERGVPGLQGLKSMLNGLLRVRMRAKGFVKNFGALAGRISL